MLKMKGKEKFQNTDQNIKVGFRLHDRASVNLMPTSVYRRIKPQMSNEDDKYRLEIFHKDWTNLVTCRGSIIRQIDEISVACKWGKKVVTNFHIVYVEDDPSLFRLKTLRNLNLHWQISTQSEKMKSAYLVKRSVTQHQKEALQELERPLEQPKSDE